MSLVIDDVAFNSELDIDGDMMVDASVKCQFFINKAKAIALVEHLQEKFALPVPTMVERHYHGERMGDRK